MKKIKISWSCSDRTHHQHRFKFMAELCGDWQRFIESRIESNVKELLLIEKIMTMDKFVAETALYDLAVFKISIVKFRIEFWKSLQIE